MKKTQIALAAFVLLAATLVATGAARADTWSAGAFTTYDQTEWGDSISAAGILLGNDYGTVYSSTGDLFHIGNTSSGFFLEFTSAFHLEGFLPANGTPGALNTDLANPTTTSAGIFAGEVAALKLNIDFSAAGLLPGTSGLYFGDLILTGMTGTDSGLNGLTVSQFLALTEQALGGADTGFTITDLDIELAHLNNAFDDGQPDVTAQDHLVAPGSSVPMPEPPTLLLAVVGLLAAAIIRKTRALGRRVGVRAGLLGDGGNMPQLTLPRCHSTRVIFVAMILLLTGCASFAQNFVWKGGSGNWTDNNWTPAAPTTTSNVSIDSDNPVASTVVLNVSATVHSLTLDANDTLTLAPITTLTVNDTATLNGTTNVALGTLTLNGGSSNAGAINLATETVTVGGQILLLGEGHINGAGSLYNTQLIEGAGNIDVALVNPGSVLATDPSHPLGVSANVNNTGGELAGRSGTLVLNGSTVTGGAVDGNLAGINGATLKDVFMGAGGTGVNVADGSTLAIQGIVTVTNNGPLNLGNGVTLTGPGTLVNSTAPTPLGAGIVAVSGVATLQVNVTQTAGSGGLIGEGGTLVLDGSTVSGGFVLGNLAGKNGATLNNVQIGVGSSSAVNLADGSTLALQGTVTNIATTLNLGDGVTLTGPGTLLNSASGESEIIVSKGQGILQVNVTQTGNNILWGQGSGTVVLDGSTVTGGYVRGNLAAKNGATLDNVQLGIDTSDTVSLADGSTLGIKHTVTNVGTLSLGAGATLNSVPSSAIVNGVPILVSGLLVNNGTIRGGGTLAVNIANNGTIVADNASAPLVLADNVTDPSGLSVFRVMKGGTLTVNSSASGQIVDVQAGGKLNGTGTIHVNDNVGNGGIVTPGMNAPGALTINGIYSQVHNGTTNGVLDFMLGGGQAGQYSQLNVNGFALFDTGSVIDASFFNGFDPSAACADVTGVCEMFDVLHLTDGMIETVVTNPNAVATTNFLGIAGLDFELPTLANGLTWSEVDLNNQDLELEIISSGGGSGGGTNVPEPSSLPLLGVGMIGLGILRAQRRRVGSLA